MTFIWKAAALLGLITHCVVAQSDSSNFQCGNPDDVTLQTLDNAGFFTNIETFYKVKGSLHDGILMPKTINYHIYAIPDDQDPAFSCYPEGLVEPRISGSTLDFPADRELLKELGYSKGDEIEAAVNLYVPVSQLMNIHLGGVEETVEVIITEDLLGNISNDTELPTLNIQSSGVDSDVYVNAPYSRVKFVGSGVDNKATIVAGKGSSVSLTGVDQDVYIKSEFVAASKLSGVDQVLMIEGAYKEIKMSGVSGKVRVNGETGCNAIDSSGVDNNCRITTDTVNLTTLDCLASTKVVKASCTGISTAAWIGIGIAILVGLVLCIGACAYGRRSRAREVYPAGVKAVSPPQQFHHEGLKNPQGPEVIEAEVIEIKDQRDEDPEQALQQGGKGAEVGAKIY